jgi:HlyD family secretion protein
LQQAAASLQLSEVNLSHATIRSPIDGVVISRNVDVGQTVAASLSAPTLFTIANDLTKMQVLASIDEADVGSVSQSKQVTFTVDAFPGQTFEGTIGQLRLNPLNVQNVVTYNVMIDVLNPDLKLIPGMTTNLSFVVAERTDVVKIPNAALRFTPSGMTQDKIRELVRASRGPGNNSSEGGDRQTQPREPRSKGGQAQQGGDSAGTRDIASRLVWVLGAEKQLQPRRIHVGVSDGVMTEVLQGNLQPDDLIIVGQNGGGSTPAVASQRPPGFSSPGGLTGGRRR